MQLRIGALLTLLAFAATARADGEFDLTTTMFYEGGANLDMLVVTPRVGARADVVDELSVQASYEADVVSGASVAVVDAPSSEVDAVSSATQLSDVRHTASGGVTLRDERASLTAGYSYGTENDYRSHSLSVAGRAELFDRTMAFDLSYARGFDSVCNLFQPRAQEVVDRARLPNSDGCFTSADRESLDVSLQTFQGAWTQIWSPVFTTQLTTTAQLIHGYQGNPYRAVWLGESSAQENHPRDRARYAAGLAARLWLSPLSGALQLEARAYRDTWDVRSITAEVGYEQALGGSLRLRVRGRAYFQSGAAFYSDDYALAPRGQYFTGDRELSPMQTYTAGARLEWSVAPDDEGDVLGFLRSLRLVAKGDWIHSEFPEFHYARLRVPNNDAIVVTGGLDAVF